MSAVDRSAMIMASLITSARPSLRGRQKCAMIELIMDADSGLASAGSNLLTTTEIVHAV